MAPRSTGGAAEGGGGGEPLEPAQWQLLAQLERPPGPPRPEPEASDWLMCARTNRARTPRGIIGSFLLADI